MTEPLFQSLRAQVSDIQSRKMTSLELTEQYIRRIESLNSRFNIVVQKGFSAALSRAREMDAQLLRTGTAIGPLHGIPFTIKDAFRVKGLRTSYGFPGLNYLPAFDSCSIVTRLVSAGGILLGHTNVPFSCFDWQTNSPIYGLTKNPLNEEYTVGGSSGGAAASVAAHFSPFEIGSDVAGSIRYPCHCCGVFGLRPTHDFVPFEDIGPQLHKRSFANLAVAGPMARSIDDLKLVLAVISQTEDSSKPKSTLKIGYTLEWSGIAADEESKQVIESLLAKIKSHGHEIHQIAPKMDFDLCAEAWGIILGYEYKQMLPLLFRFQPFIGLFNHFFNTRRFHEGLFKESFQRGLFANKATYLEWLGRAVDLRKQFADELGAFDLWITPVAATEAIRHQKTGSFQTLNSRTLPYAEFLGHFIVPTALFHHPILTAPIKGSKGTMPIGIQLHGKAGQDWQLLADCELLKEFFEPPAVGQLTTDEKRGEKSTWNPEKFGAGGPI